MTMTLPQPDPIALDEPVPAAPVATAPVAVCSEADLEAERGVAALVGGQQVALFRLLDGRVFAVQHRDPASGANVIARGIVGSRGDTPTVASPMYKEVYDLRTGVCLDNPTLRLRVFQVTVQDGVVLVHP